MKIFVALTNSNRIVQELVALLMGIPNKKGILCCAMQGLNDLIPSSSLTSLQLMISNDEEISHAVRTIETYIENYIDPFFYNNDDWDSYKELVFNYKISSWDFDRKMIIPVIYYLDGHNEKGLEYIDRKIKANLDHPEKAYGDNILDKTFLENYRNL